MSEVSACPGCGVVLPIVDGAEHPYMIGSAACWASFGELLAVQYASLERLAFHQLVVDAYAAQHPGGSDRRAVQSVGIHLMTLALILEDGTDPTEGPGLHRSMVRSPVFGELRGRAPAPDDRTVVDIPLAGSVAEAEGATRAWARDVWASWSPEHATVQAWLQVAGLQACRRD